jgi:hypothetical protein
LLLNRRKAQVIPNVSRAFSTHSAAKSAASEGFGENGPFWRRKILKGTGPPCPEGHDKLALILKKRMYLSLRPAAIAEHALPSCDFAPETEPFSLKPRSKS